MQAEWNIIKLEEKSLLRPPGATFPGGFSFAGGMEHYKSQGKVASEASRKYFSLIFLVFTKIEH